MISYRIFTRWLPWSFRNSIGKAKISLIDIYKDTLDVLSGRSDPLMPSRYKSRIFGIDNNFSSVGQEFLGHFRNIANLKPDERVLEIGCGIGRMAVALTSYIQVSGSYTGLDISKTGINWCVKHITPRFPNFTFEHADVYNNMYNPGGKYLGENYRLPYDDESFDFVFLTSVFTHMFPSDTNNYLNEIQRVMKSDGRCMVNYFLLNKESMELMNSGKSARLFVHDMDGCRVAIKEAPEEAVAHFESSVRDAMVEAGLTIIEPMHYGFWSGRKNHLSYQDIVIARKSTATI